MAPGFYADEPVADLEDVARICILCYTVTVKTYVHARLSRADRAALDQLKAATGRSESELIRHGVRLAAEALQQAPTAVDVAGASVGRFTGGPTALSVARRHLDGFGE
jgi:hypothetical protein